MSTNKRYRTRLGLAALVSLLILAGFFAFGPLRQSAAQAVNPFGMVCTIGPTFNLEATSGYISTPDGNSVFMWGFGIGNVFQMPGPVLCVNEGATVTVNLHNQLPEAVSIIFPGQTAVTTSGGSPGLFTAEAAPGGTVSYSFVAGAPGTYIYESGTKPHKQVQMGLFGVLVIRPAMGANFAYNDSATQFNPGREFLLVLHDIDPMLHAAVESGRPYDVDTMHDRYWTINGRSFPDTILANSVSWLTSQPYGALVQVEAYDASTNPLPALIRYVNAGMVNHPFHPHGNNLQVIARDGRLLRGPLGEDTSMAAFTKTIGAGQTYDLFAQWMNIEGWNSASNAVPIEIPGLQNLVFKDDITFFSGSPYLGEQGSLPAGVTSYNQCGEFYYPWHSHALNEFQNFDEGFGGLATIWRVDPPGGCP